MIYSPGSGEQQQHHACQMLQPGCLAQAHQNEPTFQSDTFAVTKVTMCANQKGITSPRIACDGVDLDVSRC